MKKTKKLKKAKQPLKGLENKTNQKTDHNKKRVNDQHNSFNTSNKLAWYPFITNYNDDYCEILYQSYDKPRAQIMFGFLCFVFMMLLILNPIITIEKVNFGIKFFIIIVDVIFLVYLFPVLKILIKQPHFQPAVFQRSQKKVYIYNFNIPFDSTSLTMGYYGKEIPKKPSIYIWDWQDVYLTTDEKKINVSTSVGGAHVRHNIYVCSLYLVNRHTQERVRLSQFRQKDHLFFISALERGRANHVAYTKWIDAYMNHKDDLINKPAYLRSNSSLWDKMILQQFSRNC